MLLKNNILKYINVYLVISILYFFIGRYNWYVPSILKLILYMIILLVSINLGYNLRLRIKRNDYLIKINSSTGNYQTNDIVLSKNIKRLFIVSCISIIFFQILWVKTVLGNFDIIGALSNIGTNYYERLEFTSEDSKVPLMQFRTLLWGLTLYAYPIGFYFFNQLSIKEKLLLLITIIIDSLASLNMGISKNIGDITLIFILVMLIKVRYKKNIYGKFKKVNNIGKILFVVSLFFLLFYIVQLMRDIETNISSSPYYNPYTLFAELREVTFYDLLFGNSAITILIDKIGTYISHGYMGLALALEIPFNNTYGIGFSRALTEYANQYLGINVQSKTYPALIEQEFGWPNGIYWASGFTWFASAVSFWGLPLLMAIYGWILASVEKRFKKYRDVFSLVLFSQLFIMAIYLPANAQIFQSRASLFGTILVSVMYIVTGRRLRRNGTSK